MTAGACPHCGEPIDTPLHHLLGLIRLRYEGRIAGVEDPEHYAQTLAAWEDHDDDED